MWPSASRLTRCSSTTVQPEKGGPPATGLVALPAASSGRASTSRSQLRACGSPFLADAGDGVDLGELIRWYRGETVSVGAWLFEQFDGLHGGEVESANGPGEDFNCYLTGET